MVKVKGDQVLGRLSGIMPTTCCTRAKLHTHTSTKPPVTTPIPHPNCSNGRHRLGDIGPLPRLTALLQAQA